MGVDEELVRVDAAGVAAAADWDALKSPETYIGYARRAAHRSEARRAEPQSVDLTGRWTIEEQSAVLDGSAGSIAYRFEGRDINLVLAPTEDTAAARFTILLDGEPPGHDHGLDVDETGAGTVEQARLYQLVRQRGPIRPRTFEIRFANPGVRAYVFTFG